MKLIHLFVLLMCVSLVFGQTGVVRETGQSSITNKDAIKSFTITNGQSAQVPVTVKSGDATEAFTVSFTCGSQSFSTGSAVQTNVLAPGESQTVTIPITGNAPTELDSTCTAKACSVNSPSTCDTADVEVHIVRNCYPLTCGFNTDQQPDCSCKCRLTSCPTGQTLIKTATTCLCQENVICGDGICEPGEDALNCITDCSGDKTLWIVGALVLGLLVGGALVFVFVRKKK